MNNEMPWDRRLRVLEEQERRRQEEKDRRAAQAAGVPYVHYLFQGTAPADLPDGPDVPVLQPDLTGRN